MFRFLVNALLLLGFSWRFASFSFEFLYCHFYLLATVLLLFSWVLLNLASALLLLVVLFFFCLGRLDSGLLLLASVLPTLTMR